MEFAAVVIGRNEGERLKRCLRSLSEAKCVVYVDSGSSDGSVIWARDNGVHVIQLDAAKPFTAARARNAGFQYLNLTDQNLAYVQFIDGDCELDKQWPQAAIKCLDARPELAAVCGRTRERFPNMSVFNWLCDVEWDVAPGEARAFAGAVMIRSSALRDVGGYRDDLIAGEEPELSVRLRAAGWRIWRLRSEMILHDAAMTRFGQWWRRAVRAGYAFAQGAHLHGAPPEHHWVWESRRAWLWGVWLPLCCLVISVTWAPWGLATWLVYPVQMLRQIVRNSGTLNDRAKLAFFQVLARFPEAEGQFQFLWHRVRGVRSGLVYDK